MEPDTYDAYQEQEDFARLCDYLFEDRVRFGPVHRAEMREIQARWFVTPRKPVQRKQGNLFEKGDRHAA